MALSLVNAIKNNIVLKCMALIIGCSLWLMVSSLHTSTLWVEVPVSFYNQHDNIIIHAPNTIQIQLSGSHSAIRTINYNNLAVHIDAQELHDGKNPLELHAYNLFLPDLISMVNYSPLNSYIEKITH